VFKIKTLEDGTVDRFKARLGAQGFSQRHGVDYDETFLPVATKTTIRVLIGLRSQRWHVRHIDVDTAYLNADLNAELYIQQPKGFEQHDDQGEILVCKLMKTIYGLKQAGLAWFDHRKQGDKPADQMPLLDQIMHRIHVLHGTKQPNQRKPIFWWMLHKIRASGNVRSVKDKNMLAIALLGRKGLYRLGELTADSNSLDDFSRTEQWSCDRSRGVAHLELHQGKTNKWRKAIRVVHPLENQESAAELVESLLANRSRALPPTVPRQKKKADHTEGIILPVAKP
jgi:hypothetical protein